MPKIRKLIQEANRISKAGKTINWHPGHMFAGMQAMMGKLSTVDCVIEVHDARIPFVGRNIDLKQQLGTIKPHLLILNKCDLADLSNWERIKKRLDKQGDTNVLLTDLTGHGHGDYQLSHKKVLERALTAINSSERYNRQESREFKLMVVGIPNSGKSTLINRLRQHHLGRGGEATKTGSMAGVTRHVEFKIKACSRPPVYILDTPGILRPGETRNRESALQLALCASITDKVLDPRTLTNYLLDYLQRIDNLFYRDVLGLEKSTDSVSSLLVELRRLDFEERGKTNEDDILLWRFIRRFRQGDFGKVLFD